MANNKNCSACSDLRKDAANFVINGLTNTEINSLKNNTGLNPSSGNKDCEDLNNMNDCLLDNLESQVDGFSDCSWKPFMKELLPNIVTVFRGIIASICGLWAKVERQECLTNVMFNGINFRIDEEPTEGGSYVVAGKGISFLIPQGSQTGVADASLNYIGGALVYGSASLQWFQEDFTDRDNCVNFDNGSTERTSKARKGNPYWNTSNALVGNGELLLEFRINRKEYPEIRNFYNGFGQETGGGHYQVRAMRFNAGTYAYGQHGACNTETGTAHTGCDAGHLVPPDYTYVQLRLTSLFSSISNNTQVSPAWLMGVRINQDGAGC